MSDSPTPPDARPEADEVSQAAPDTGAARPRQVGRRRTALARFTRRGFAIAVAVLATAVVALFTVDLARLYPGIVSLAEENASRYLERPMRIGRISAMLTPGRFALDDVVIEGRDPGDRPFFTARRIYVHVPLWRIALGQIDIELEIDDWRMVVESWEGNRNNLPRFTRRQPASGPKRFNTTVRFAYARNGHFTYEDHATPWSVVAPNLHFSLVRAYNLKQYVGLLRFSEGSTQIQRFLPMRTDMSTRFVLNGGNVHLQHLDLLTDGAVSHVTGDVDFGRWPDQVYSIRSTVDFPRMRELFFANERWRLSGEGEFSGVFQYTRDGKRDLTGSFTSDLAGVNDLEFRDLHGSLEWTRQRFVVHHADATLFGGETRLQYGLAPLGTRGGATATFSATYRDVDLFDVDRVVDLRGLRLRGLATGTLAMQWPNGRFAAGRRGEGHTVITPIGDVLLATATLPDEPRPTATEPQPFDGQPRESTLTFGSDVHYQFDPNGTTFDRSWAATPFTFIEFNGRMGPGGAATFPFHVTSHDWQESDRLLATIMTAVSGPTGAVEVGGRGRFDGQMTGTFSSPRVTGHFDGEGTRAWGVTWGRALADIVIEGGYVTIANSRIGGDRADAVIVPDGRFALGFRKDGREELEARVSFANWPMRDLKTAFQLNDWSMDGTVGSATLNLRGHYRNMFGNGQVRIDQGVAWGEAFESARADVELEGNGMLLRRLDMRKGPGVIRGSARIGWDGTYAFNAEGVAIPVELLDNFKTPRAPLTGRLDFNASGAGPFESPVYTFDGSMQDLFVGDEGIGAVTGRLTVANDILTVERLLATSSRLVARASGTVAFDDVWTSNLDVRFQETSLDPYLKFVLTNDISPYTRIVVAGSLAVRGPLGDPLAIRASTTIDAATLTLYDYDLTNDGPIQLTFDQGALKIGSFRLKGADTSLALTGGASQKARTFDLAATGNASLAILQLFYKSVAASGAATLNASLSGTFDDPRLTGAASIADGRLRPLDSPHSLEAINGNISFGGSGVRLDGLRGRIGTGDVTFGGNISLDGYRPDQFNLTASGRSMRLRYPAGFNSTVDMDLFLTGPLSAPRLSGNIDVLRLSYLGQVSPDGGLLGLSGAAAEAVPSVPPVVSASATPLVLDIQVTAPRTSFVNTRTARIEGQADLQVRGTFDRPQILGTVDILGGEYIFNGNRYFVREGTVDFTNPDQLEPNFNVSAETRARVTGQTFTVNVRLTGTLAALNVNLTSDPWLPESDIVTLLFGGTPNWGAAEQRALVSSQELQQRMFQTAGATLLTSALTERVGDVFERTGALDTVQITPLLTNQTAFQQLDPSARITLGKRISPRLFLTYSRSFDTKQEEIILLEYDQNDRLSWVLSRNEDRTYALDFRLRYVF